MKSNGFSFIEVLVVLLLISLLSAFAIPSWLSFWHRQQIRSAANELHSSLAIAKSMSRQRLIRYALTVCSPIASSSEDEWIAYSIHNYADTPSSFTTIKNVSLVKSTVRRSPSKYNLPTLVHGNCYTSYVGVSPGDGYTLGFFFVSKRNNNYVYKVGFNTLIGNIASCPVVSLQRDECY